MACHQLDRDGSGDSELSLPLNLGQWYYPDEAELGAIVREIYVNKYYTNHGPLAKKFEASLTEYFIGKEAVVATNATLSLMMTLVGLGVAGSVIVPAVSSPGVTEAVIWSGLNPIFSDVDPLTGHITVETISKVVSNDVSVIVALSMWGNVCDVDGLRSYASRSGIQLIHYAVDAFGASVNNVKVGEDDVTTIFSFHGSKILSCSEGGCVVTNDSMLARRIRNIRSSYGAGPFVKVPVTANGRFSEFQAALGLWSLSRLSVHCELNRGIVKEYEKSMACIDGLKILNISHADSSNYQDIAIVVDEQKLGVSRDHIQKTLNEHGVQTRPKYDSCLNASRMFKAYHTGDELLGMEYLAGSVLQLPVGAKITAKIAIEISEIIKASID